MKKLGKFIAIYGINNLGKTLQAKMLEERLLAENFKVKRIKYPVYDLEPTGPRINAYLRKGNPDNLSAKAAQLIYVQNRKDFEPTLKAMLRENDFVIAEDYKGTGIAWGMGAGVEKNFLLYHNGSLLEEDVSILLDGKRFREGIESGHTHESNDELTEKVRLAHLELADYFHWPIVNANDTKEAVHEKIYEHVMKKIKRL